MAFQRIRIKNSSVAGKIPDASALDPAELAINLKDQRLYSKDADGNVFEVGGSVNSGDTPPGTDNNIGDLFWDGDILIWNGTDWEPVAPVTSVNGEVGDVVLELGDLDDVAVDGVVDEQVLVYDANQGKWVPASAASLAVDVDLGYTAAPAKGTVTNTAGDDAELPLVNATNAGLMSPADFEKLEDVTEIGDGTLTIKDVNGDALGTFTANQVDDSEITIPATKWEEIEGNPITIGGPQPNNPSLGDIWIDTGDCPPTINIWDDCDDPGNPTWTPIGGGGGGGCVQGPVQITSSNGTELNSTLTAVGGNGVDESTTLTATYEWTGAKTGTGSSIVADVEGNYTVTASITCVDGSVLRNSAVWTVSDTYVDMVNNTPPVIAVVGEGIDGAYEGNSIYVVSNATVLNGEIPSIVETQWFKDGVADGTGSIYTISAGNEGAVITAKQLFRDLRSNELLSLASNEITIVERPADAITFTAVITDDGTPTGNTPGHDLTASATNIVGGTSPTEYAYQWKSGGVATVTTKTYTLVEGDVGKVITCDVTVAEPDGSNAETRTATYAKAIEIAGTINKPTVLAPSDGAGSGNARYLKSDTIIEVEGGGIDTCETDLIENVDDTTDAPNVILTFPTNKDFACFAQGEGVQEIPSSVTKTYLGYESYDGSEQLGISSARLVAEETFGVQPTGGNNKLSQVLFDLKTPLHDVVLGHLGGQTLNSLDIYGSDTGDENSWVFIKNKPTGTALTSSGSTPYRYLKIIRVDPGGAGAMAYSNYGIDSGYLPPDEIKVISKDEDANTITVDGGDWTGSDGSGTPGEQTTLTKQVPYDTKLTLAGSTDLADMTGSVLMTDGTGAPGPYTQTPYKLVTTDIESVDNTDPDAIELTFPGDVSTNPDLQYFRQGDVVQQPDVKVISNGYDLDPKQNTLTVDGGNWDLTKGAPYIGYKLIRNYDEADPVFDITTADESAQEEFGQRPSGNVSTNNNSGWLMFDCLQELSGLTFKYWGTDVPVQWRVQRSDDGVNWVDDHTKANDNTKESTSTSGIAARYWRMARFGSNKINIMVYQNYGISDTFVIPQTLNVEYQTNGGEGKIVATNTDDNTILLTNTGDGDNRWIIGTTDSAGNAGNSGETGDAAGAKDFYVAGPISYDRPLLTADVELLSSNFATTPDNADSLKNIVWELNGATQDAGLSNPYKPTLSTDTTYTVRVKHQGNSLEDSAWSTSTTFTTGATRNLYTYYKERVELLEARLAGIEADEIVDDATDVTLLTAFANLVERVEALENP